MIGIMGILSAMTWSFMTWLRRREFKPILSPHVKKVFAPILVILFNKEEKYEIAPLDTKVNYSNTNWDATSILHFLVHTGYLTYKVEQNKAFVSIPNKEVYMYWEKEVTNLINFAFTPQFKSRFETL